MTKAAKKADVTQISRKGDIEKAPTARQLSAFEEMERMFDSIFSRSWMTPFHLERPSWDSLPKPFTGRMPNIDVIDRDNEVLVRAELPGVDKDDIEVSLTDNTVTIKGSKKEETKEEKGDYYRQEISQGSFARTVSLPADVDTEHSKAKFTDSVLELTLPKHEKAKKKTIRVE